MESSDKIKLGRYKKIYSTQSWYNDDIYIFIKVYYDRYMPRFGYDCEWKNLKTGVIHHNWHIAM